MTRPPHIGDAIIDAITQSGALAAACKNAEDGRVVFIWKIDAADRIEAAMNKRFEDMIRAAATNETLIQDCLCLLRVGNDKGHPFNQTIQVMLANFMFRALGVNPSESNDKETQ